MKELLKRLLSKKILLLIASIIFMASVSAYSLEVPRLKSRVNDYGNMISDGTVSRLETRLKDFEATDSTQVVILTVESLEGDSMEDFTIRVAEQWKIGQAKKDNGVILFASKNDRKMRIEVGYGLEGVLTDLLAGRILDNVIGPRFRAGDFDEGFTAGIEAIIQACKGEFKNDKSYERSDFDDFKANYFMIIFFILINGSAGFFKSLFPKKGKLKSAGIISIPVILISGLLFYFGGYGMTTIIIFIIIAAIIIFLVMIDKGSSGRRGGWSSGGGRGSFGGGGFSGGGGSFGGGGASGRW